MQAIEGLTCTHHAIQNDVPHQIWAALTSFSPDTPIWFVRLLHNKPRYFATNYAQCYLHYLSPKFLFHQWGLVGLIILVTILLIALKTQPKKFKLLWIIIAIYPLIMIFELYQFL